MISPLTSPTPAPSNNVAPMASGMPKLPSRMATTQAANACSEPIDRSNEPIASASVMPRAGTAMMAAVISRLRTFPGCRKFGATLVTRATTSTIMISTPTLSKSWKKRSARVRPRPLSLVPAVPCALDVTQTPGVAWATAQAGCCLR